MAAMARTSVQNNASNQPLRLIFLRLVPFKANGSCEVEGKTGHLAKISLYPLPFPARAATLPSPASLQPIHAGTRFKTLPELRMLSRTRKAESCHHSGETFPQA
jgi:hypothetical protein